MPTMNCPQCGGKIETHAGICPQCQALIPEIEGHKAVSKQKRKKVLMIFTAVVLTLGLSIYLYELMPEPIKTFMSQFTKEDGEQEDGEQEGGEKADALELTGAPQPYKILREVIWRDVVSDGRDSNRLIISLMRGEDGFFKDDLKHEDLIATVAEVAEKQYGVEEGISVVDVWLMSDDTKSYCNLVIAKATYVPDKQGFSGKESNSKAWFTLQAVDRSLTQAEQQYLTVCGDRGLSGFFLRRWRSQDSEKVQEMNTELKSLDPFSDTMLDYPTE